MSKTKSRSKSKSMTTPSDPTTTSLLDDETSSGDFSVAVLEGRDEEPYGCLGWAPECLQGFRRHPIGLLVVLSILVTASAYIQYGSFPASLTHVGNKFSMKTEVIAQIRVFYDLGALVILVPVMYYGQHGVYRAQAISIGGSLVALGGVTMTLAHFISWGVMQTLQTSKKRVTICQPSAAVPVADQGGDVDQMLNFKYLFMFGEFLVGLGSVPATIIGVTYLDENVTHLKSALYTAILSVFEVIGPMCGYLITGQTGEIEGYLGIGICPKNASRAGGPLSCREEVKRSDLHRWYGAWWIGMLVGVFIAYVGAVLMFPFPRQLSGAVQIRLQNMREALMLKSQRINGQATEHDSVNKAAKDLFTNSVFVGTAIDEALRACLTAGICTFLVAHIRNTFGTDPGVITVLIGGGIFFAALLGLCFGTFLQYTLRLQITGNLRLCVTSATIALLLSAVFMLKCPEKEIIGITHGYPWSNGSLMLNNTCNMNCNCDGRSSYFCYTPDPHIAENSIYPIPKKVTFFSKCHAGCLTSDMTNCTCTGTPNIANLQQKGSCKRCTQSPMYAFVIGVSWVAAAIFVRANSIEHVQLRCVNFKLRLWALGFSMAFSRFAAGGGVLLFAWVKRQSCGLSAKRPGTDEHLFCSWYDNKKMALYLTIMVASIQLVSLLALIVAMLTYREPRLPAATLRQLSAASSRKESKREPPARTASLKSLSSASSKKEPQEKSDVRNVKVLKEVAIRKERNKSP